MALIVCWKDAISLRYYFGIPFLLYAAIFLLTRFYFVPRDIILFASENQYSNEQLKAVLNQWERINWVRAAIGLAGIILTCKGLELYYNTAKNKKA